MFLEIWELDQQSKKPEKKTRTLSVYNNPNSQGCIWNGSNLCIKQALKDVK